MNWTIILVLSIFGGIMGFLSVRGYTQKLEPLLWLLFSIITSFVLAKNITHKPFIHALLIGFCWGIVNGLIQSIFFEQYLANNPNLQNSFKKSSFMQPRYFVLVTGPVIGIVTGVVLGGLTYLFKKIV